jgi:hypothetical protein
MAAFPAAIEIEHIHFRHPSTRVLPHPGRADYTKKTARRQTRRFQAKSNGLLTCVASQQPITGEKNCAIAIMRRIW